MPVWPAATAWQQGHTCIPAAVASAHQQPQSRGSSRWLEPPACGTRHAKRPISVCNAQPSGPDFEVIPPRRRPQPSSTLGEDGVEEYDLEDLENQYFETAEEAEQALQRKREEAAQRRAETTDEESEEFSRNSEEYEEEDPQARQRYEEYGDDPEGLSLGYGPNALGLPRDHMLLDRAPLPEVTGLCSSCSPSSALQQQAVAWLKRLPVCSQPRYSRLWRGLSTVPASECRTVQQVRTRLEATSG